MRWSIERFERDLLSGPIDSIAVPSNEILESLDRVEDVLGSEWIKSKGSAKGLGPAIHIFGTGLRLASLEHLDNTHELIRKLQLNDPSADTELTAIHLLRSNNHSVSVELYPSVGSKVADFRVRRPSEEWTTVEVTQAGTSSEHKRIYAIVGQLVHVFRHVESAFSLEVIFQREPTEKEISLLCAGLPELCQRSRQERYSLINGLGFLFLNHAAVGHLPHSKVPEIATVPMIGLATFFATDRVVSVSIPFADKRAEAFLRKEARQLPKSGSGLIMIAGISSAKELGVWKPLIESRFRPSIHTRVSGVCLFDGGMVQAGNLYSWGIEAHMVSNPYSQSRLPDWIRAVIPFGG